ncbi:hypothetical protein KZ483_24195 [Paenibacillus sp. sptzw28]|uniref:hypothetical protein n=1 Tax=Paenibacillus sp. sptzw28 TaxID=715179 RepID=UPI001C6E3C14|nr:hypothetical protein [Paenibacillus sp. sptzw28]QYR20822.1 hypothetical protein KZ483_24195 [Paenibacillus sp. sptzw28]
MDYRALFIDVEKWIQEANEAAKEHGMDHQDFWKWVADSSSALCKKYQDNRLVIKQMMMLVEWLEEVFQSRKNHS